MDQKHDRLAIAREGYPSVTRVLRDAGYYDDLRSIPEHLLQRARLRGQAIGTAIQYDLEGDLDLETVDPIIQPYLDAFSLFEKEARLDRSQCFTEQPVYHDVAQYWGKPDLLCALGIGGQWAIVDVKVTATTPISTRLQIAAYRLASEAPEAYALQLKSNGTYKLIDCSDPAYGIEFLDAVKLWHGRN